MGVGASKRLSAVKWGVVERIVWLDEEKGFTIAELGQEAGAKVMNLLTKGIKKIVPAFPLWSNQLIVSGSMNPSFAVIIE